MPAQHFRSVLGRRLGELTDRLHEIDHDLEEPIDRNWDEAAIQREDDEVLERLGRSGLDEVRAIRAALHRLDDGSFGVCAKCGEPISLARLEAVPTTQLCRNCVA